MCGERWSEGRREEEGGANDMDSGCSLDVGHGIALGEGVRVSLSEDVANSGAGKDLHRASTHPRAEGNLCEEALRREEG